MPGRLACALALLCGCGGADVVLGAGRSPTDAGGSDAEDATAQDATTATDADARDAGEDAAMTDAAIPRPVFGPPSMIEGLSSAETTDDDPSLTADRLLLYFNSEREGGAGEEDIWYAERSAIGGPWSAPRAALELNTEDRETGIALSADGLTLYWSSNRPGGAGGLDVYVARRADRAEAFGGFERVAELSTPGDDLISSVSADGLTALLAHRDDDETDYDLFVARRASAQESWQPPRPVDELNTDAGETDGFLVFAGSALIFTRSGDLRLARRTEPAGAFGEPERLDELNSDEDDRDAWASEDFDYVIFASDRGGSYALYEAFR